MSMIHNGKEVPFPAIMQISFFKLFEQLEEMAKDADKNISTYAQGILEEMKDYPELRDGFEDLALLETHKEQIDKLCRILFPDALLTNEIKALSPPFYFKPMYSSTRYKSIMKNDGGDFSYHLKDVDEDTFYMYCCYFILGSYFGFPVNAGGHLNLQVFNEDQGLSRSYKLAINADMIEFLPTKKAVTITREDYEHLVDNFEDIEVWKKKFPPNSWIMRGVNITNFMDVTIDESLASITSNLLFKSTDSFEKISNGIRSLFNSSKLDIGVLTLEQKNLTRLHKDEVKSILLGANKDEKINCDLEMCDTTISKLIEHQDPLIIPDVDRFNEVAPGFISERLNSLGYKSYIMAPLCHEGELIGFMEMASFNRYELNSFSLARLSEVLPVLSMAHKRFSNEAQNLIEAIIQQECTTIHSSVKWRFEQEASKFMNRRLNNENPVFQDIIFNNLYPLYGQMDIKGSSARRNEAVKADLLKQINGVVKVLKMALQTTEMPIYEELIYHLNSYKRELNKGLSAGSEHKILGYLKSEVYPVFEHIQVRGNTKIKELVDNYNKMLDPELRTVYEERKKYDTSVNVINQRLASYLDKKQTKAQSMYPHYFERYKTDGVEYNMYIGQSITPHSDFDKIYLRNLRLWQLITMCEMENEFRVMQGDLSMSIEIASLILVYNTPLAVHFRMDEKRFDVEGAYNARYEIIKKRVDKAHIKGTDERITQPGHIAIVYSQESDAVEYRKYLTFMTSKGYFQKGFEDVELEDLQGVTGLRALRAKVSYSEGLTVDELIEAIEEGNPN